MSTHIYNAFRIKKSLDDLFEITQAWKKDAKEKVEELKCAEFCKIAVGELDLWCLDRAGIKISSEKNISKDNPALYKAWSKIREENMEAQKAGRTPFYNWNLELFLFKVSKTTWLIQINSQSNEMIQWAKKKIEKMGGEEFEYWDNTDRPEHLSESQWAFRKGVWNKIFKDTTLFREAGLNIVLSDQGSDYFMPSEDRVMVFQPSLEERVQAQWLEMGWERIYQKILDKSNSPSTSSMALVVRAQKEAQKGEWDKDYLYRSRIEKALLPHYKTEHLTNMESLEVDFDRNRLQQNLETAEKNIKPRL